jgi:hypothetical protein
MKILVAKEKYDTRYLDASTTKALARSALELLKERLDSGWYPKPNELFPDKENQEEMSQEAINALPERYRVQEEKRQKALRREKDERTLYQQWYNRVKTVIRNKDLSCTSIGKNRSKSNIPLAWQLLLERTDYEYESVELREVETP